MRAGYWLNYENGKEWEVEEHELFLRMPGNAARMGVPANVIKRFDDFEPITDRDKFLLSVLQHSPLMRVRGYGSDVSFEYSSHSRNDPMDAILKWGENRCGDYTSIDIHNFATGEHTSLIWKDFVEAMDEGGSEKVMRVAKVNKTALKESVARELLAIAGRLAEE